MHMFRKVYYNNIVFLEMSNSIVSWYCIAGNFQGRKLLQIGKKCDFRKENFRRLLAFATPKDATSPNFVESTFANSHKTVKFAEVFCFESFPLYGIPINIK